MLTLEQLRAGIAAIHNSSVPQCTCGVVAYPHWVAIVTPAEHKVLVDAGIVNHPTGPGLFGVVMG